MSIKLQELFCDKIASELAKTQVKSLSLAALNLIDKNLINEIKTLIKENVCLYFGTSLRDIKCVIQDENGYRQHELFIKYKAPKKLILSSVKLPHSPLQDREYKTLGEIVTMYQSYIDGLSSYFHQLERIDQCCTVMEPLSPSFKDDYRKILLDDRTWLHVEVTPEGLATNIHLVGHSEIWHNMLHSGLLTWDHDKDIVDNIMTVFDLTEFPILSHEQVGNERLLMANQTIEVPTCGICLCDELPDNIGMPQPLCQNSTCGVYFHRNCLYQWLVACSGSRPPAFGVATGVCPTCLQPIACSEKDT